jgi:2-dehydropantoate 2-reductase
MEIKTVALIGLGALGILYGNQLSLTMPPEDFKVIADKKRIEKYESLGIYSNKERCKFRFIRPDEETQPADLILFAVKDKDLESAIQAVKNHVGEKTIILSLLNGITSEAKIGEIYGMDKLLYSVVQGTDGIRIDNKLEYFHKGKISFGEGIVGLKSDRVDIVARFFERTGIQYEIVTDMRHRLWGKFMLNVGVNQTVAVYETNYGGIQQEGEARETMILAMREVIPLALKEGISLSEKDVQYWLEVLSTLGKEGQPSMRQDLKAKRYSEVGLFSGTVLALGEKHGISTPVNRWLYNRITYIESKYEG